MQTQKPFTIFILDDDKWYGTMLQYFLSLNTEFKVKCFDNTAEFLNALKETPAVVTLDYSMPDMNGMEVMELVKTKNPETEVIIVSSQEDVNVAVNCLKKGAKDYIVKNKDANDNLKNSLKKIKYDWQISMQECFFAEPLY
jgi:FixJ family two-component response regulator